MNDRFAGEVSLVSGDDFLDEFFAPSSTDMVDGLVGQYRQARERIAAVAQFAEGDTCKAVIDYFLSGNANEDRGRLSMQTSAAQMFQEDGAVAALNAAYWSKALNLTDVYDAMPQARREEWNKVIREQTAPEFEETVVRDTLIGLLNSRAKFLAERVDGIFRALSGEHVTNSPGAFRNRMIVANLVTSYGTTAWERVGFINDLRCVIAKFMGREEPKWDASSSVVDFARRERRGEWVTLDGGALRLRAYKCGTAHLEVHPDMAWRLNCVLAHLYPLAIPPEFRAKPKKQSKSFVMMGRPLPFAVVALLAAMEKAYVFTENTGPDAWRNKYRRSEIKNAVQFHSGAVSQARKEAERVLAYLGGVKVSNERGGEYFEFDFHPGDAIKEVAASGCLPDQKAHQYYPTPEGLAQVAVDTAQIGPHHECLEPSAGTGSLADLMPKTVTTCVEISPLHCKVLEAKGFNVAQSDFLKWESAYKFDRIVMNPPFASGRWQLHIEHASALLAKGGRLVAILPASAKGKDVLPGWDLEWSRVFDNEFAGASVSVVILTATTKNTFSEHAP